jgi:hypothetical protein
MVSAIVMIDNSFADNDGEKLMFSPVCGIL